MVNIKLLCWTLTDFIGKASEVDMTRLTKLAAFQQRALTHALSFPPVERIVYSTCSIHQIENEDVIKSVLPLASSYGFHLETTSPQWSRHGFPAVYGWAMPQQILTTLLASAIHPCQSPHPPTLAATAHTVDATHPPPLVSTVGFCQASSSLCDDNPSASITFIDRYPF
ncbi:hypothetical protein Nepgr_000990 [Nepenthes gracilis]|uniref:SAM-dependent MTase RsmB/NOP-type domain-containing protein n=1 Tax=Nepenthes gracilis TaxID=150966 RepID=A0AAD3RX02_NEPGR|nr:hypothetical protein Nepgr_000990 [Nepenthes gracilis]